jgi:alpha-beta hydrolase superfamily lysophospholipase
MPAMSAPVLFVAGDADSKVLPEETRRLFDACSSPSKRLRWIRGARHVSLWEHDAAEYAAALNDLLAEVGDPGDAPPPRSE